MSKVQKPTDRINPCLQHERRLLGCLLNYPEQITAVMGMTPPVTRETFLGVPHIALWESIESLHKEGAPVELDSLWRQIEQNGQAARFSQLGGINYLIDLQKGTDIPNAIPELLLVVQGEASRRKLAQTYPDATDAQIIGWETEDPDQIKGVRWMRDIQPQEVRWLWPGFIPAGKLTLLVGNPGLGKSTLTFEIVARLSRGVALPGAEAVPAMACALCCPEDDDGDTIRPRLDAADFDENMVCVLKDVRTIPEDLPLLEQIITRYRIGLVVFDPVVSFLSGKLNAHKEHDVRRGLSPLVELAQRTGCAVLGVMHQNKQRGGQALHRAGGSVAFVGIARAAMMLGIDPDDPERRVLAPLKNNLAPESKSLRIRLETPTGHKVARVEWLGECDVTADMLNMAADDVEEQTKVREAMAIIREELAAGPKPRTEVINRAKSEGIAPRTLRRARDRLGIPGDSTDWSLPPTQASKSAA